MLGRSKLSGARVAFLIQANLFQVDELQLRQPSRTLSARIKLTKDTLEVTSSCQFRRAPNSLSSSSSK